MADNTGIDQNTLDKLLADDLAPLQADIMAIVVDGYKTRPGSDGKDPDARTKMVLKPVVASMASAMHSEAKKLENTNQLNGLSGTQLTEKLLVAASTELNRVKNSPTQAESEQDASVMFNSAEEELPNFISIITGVQDGKVSPDAPAYKALNQRLAVSGSVEQRSDAQVGTGAGEVRVADARPFIDAFGGSGLGVAAPKVVTVLAGDISDDRLQANPDDPFVQQYIKLSQQVSELQERNKKTGEQQNAISKADQALKAQLDNYKKEKGPLVTEKEGDVNAIIKGSTAAVEEANEQRRLSNIEQASLSPKLQALKAKIDAYLAKKASGTEPTDSELKDINNALEALPSDIRSLDSRLNTIQQLATNVDAPSKKLKDLIDPPPPPPPAPAIGEENAFYTEAKKQFAGAATGGGLDTIYQGFTSKEGAPSAKLLLAGLSSPSMGEDALKGWPEGKPRYAAPGNPQGAIAAALETAIGKENAGQSELRRFFKDIPIISQGASYVDPTGEDFLASQGIDNASRVIYLAGLEGFKEAGLDPKKKYTTEELRNATQIIAGKVRSALLNENSSNNDLVVVGKLTGINSEGALDGEYGVNLAGVYQALLTSQYGTPQAKLNFEANAKTQADAEKAKAAAAPKASGAMAAGTGLLGIYASLTNDPSLTEDLVKIVDSNDPEAVAKIAFAVGKGGGLAREISEKLKKEAGINVTIDQAQRFVDKAAAPALYETLRMYGGHLVNGAPKLNPKDVLDIGAHAGSIAAAKMAELGTEQIGALASPEVRDRLAGVGEGDGSSLSVASLTTAMFAAKSGDLDAREMVLKMGERGEEKNGKLTDKEIIRGLKGYAPEVSQAALAANRDAEGTMWTKMLDYIMAFFACLWSGFDHSIGEEVASRRQDRFDCSYKARLSQLDPKQRNFMDTQSFFNLSRDRIFEERAGIDAAHSLANPISEERKKALQGTEVPQPGVYYMEGNNVKVFDPKTDGSIDPAVLQQAEAAVKNNGAAVIIADLNGDHVIDPNVKNGSFTEVNVLSPQDAAILVANTRAANTQLQR